MHGASDQRLLPTIVSNTECSLLRCQVWLYLDDAGSRQHHADVANVPGVAQHFVHHMSGVRAAGWHLGPHVLHILLAKLLHILHHPKLRAVPGFA